MSPYVSDATTNPNNSGEGILIINDPTYRDLPDLNAIQDAVNVVTGLSPTTEDRAVMIEDESGAVTSSHFVDPACGDQAFPGHTMVSHSNAVPGWFRIEGRFIALSAFRAKATKILRRPGLSRARNKLRNRAQ